MYGLVAVGCMAAGHIVDFDLAKTMNWVLDTNDECLYNSLIAFDDSWMNALTLLAYIGLIFCAILYLFILTIKPLPAMYILYMGISIIQARNIKLDDCNIYSRLV